MKTPGAGSSKENSCAVSDYCAVVPEVSGGMSFATNLRSLADRLGGIRAGGSNVLVISGFWRSGTTWVMRMAGDILGARTIFEPLSPKSGGVAVYQVDRPDFPGERKDREVYMPCARPAGTMEPWAEKAIMEAVCGVQSDAWIQRERKGFSNLFSKAVVLKEVRLSLCLPWVLETMPGRGVVHVVRDPRSVIAGILRRPGWASGAFENIDLGKQLLDRQCVRRTLGANLSGVVGELAEGEAIERLAAFWCATQRAAVDYARHSPERLRMARYEDLVVNGDAELSELLRCLGFDPARAKKVRRGATTTTDQERRDIPDQSRLTSWKGTLTDAEVEIVERVVERFGMQDWMHP